MAATNYTPIQLYHSTTASAVPVNTNLVDGELAINIADGKLYYKDSGGTVQVIATKATGTIGGSTTQVQYNSSGSLAGSANFTFNGTTATINTLNLTNALGAAYGGTAQSTYTQGDLLYASAANTLSKLAIGSNTYILTSNGTIPGWAAPSSISVNTATNLAGGAGGSVPYQSGAGATTFLSIGTANQVMTSSGSLPQWSSGLSITTLTASDAVTFSATTQNIALGTSQTTGTFMVGGASQTGALTLDQSTKTHTLNLGTGATESGLTKTINLGTGGVATSTTAINIGSANGTTTTVSGAFVANGGAVFNENGANVDFRVEGDTDANLFFVDASADAVGIGTNAPLGKVHSFSSSSGASPSSNGNQLVLESSGNAGLTIATGASSLGNIFFADSGDNADGYIQYDQSGRSLRFGTATAEKLRITSGGQVNIGGNFTSTNNTLQVTGNAAIGYTTAAPTTGLIVAGNVGVGTDAPQTQVHISGAGSQTLALERTGAAVSGRFEIISGNNTNLLRAVTAKPLVFEQGTGNPVMRLDTSGNLGLGVEPSAWGSTWKAFQISNRSLAQTGAGAGDLTMVFNGYFDSTDSRWEFQGAGDYAARYSITGAGVHSWHISTAAGANANDPITFNQAMTLDASGNLAVGLTSASNRIHVQTATTGSVDAIRWTDGATDTGYLGIVAGGGARLWAGGFLAFGAGGGVSYNERARITSGGYFKASNNGNYDNSSGTYHEFYQTANSNCLYLRATNASYTSSVLGVVGDRTTTNGTYNLVNVLNGNSTGQFIVRDSGNAINTNGSYGTISDQKLKQDIVDAGSQWADIKAIRFRKYRMKSDVAVNPDAPALLGVVAQELEQTSPGLIETTADRDAEGNDLGTTTKSVKTSVLLMKAAVALQEAMARIEKLEAEVAALKGV